MRTRILLAAAASLALALMALADAASAGRLRFSPGDRGIRFVWSSLELELTFNGTPYSVACPVTLEGSLHSATIAKVAGSLIGFITRAVAAEAACRGRIGSESPYPLELTFLRETLPWHVRYASFAGLLPNIVTVNTDIVGAALEVHDFVFELTCLWASTAASPFRVILIRDERGVITGSRPEPSSLIPRVRGLLCSRTLSAFSLTERVTQLGSTAPLTLTLI